MHRRVVVFCIFFQILYVSSLYADQDCYGVSCSLVQSISDGWGVAGDNTVYNRGTNFSFWEQPISCVSTTFDEQGFMIEYKKELVCVPPSLILVITAPRGGECTITGKPTTQNYYKQFGFDNPCLYFGGMHHSNYGEVTTKYSMYKYKRVCPENSFSQKNNFGQPPGCN